MRIVRDQNQITAAEPSFVAIGCFDGIHRAHRKILETVVSGRSEGLTPAVFTFTENPDPRTSELMTTEDKLRIMEEIGIEVVYLLPFRDVKDIEADIFVREILQKKCRAQKVCAGYNFHFGKGGRADTDTLKSLCDPLSIEVVVAPEMTLLGDAVSSTRIRTMIAKGEIETANELLGRPFSLQFPVVHGKSLGRKIGVPTMNQLLPENFVRPKSGVYCSETIIDGKAYCSVTNVGHNPTVGGKQLTVETWIQDYSGDLYGRAVPVCLLSYLREERKFSDLTALREQIHRDREASVACYKAYRNQ